jgi:hypothetical protein
MKFVAVDEPMAKAGPEMPLGFMESCAHGDVVPIPTFPPLKYEALFLESEKLPSVEEIAVSFK